MPNLLSLPYSTIAAAALFLVVVRRWASNGLLPIAQTYTHSLTLFSHAHTFTLPLPFTLVSAASGHSSANSVLLLLFGTQQLIT